MKSKTQSQTKKPKPAIYYVQPPTTTVDSAITEQYHVATNSSLCSTCDTTTIGADLGGDKDDSIVFVD